MTLHSPLELAIELAVNAHKGQVDKGGNPYILHPLSVMNRVDNMEEKIVAVLHDIVEDTSVTLKDLTTNGLDKVIIEAIDCLTRRKGETYMTYIDRAKKNELAKAVKLADLEENMDLARIKHPTEQDYSRLKRYEKSYKRLKA